MNDETERLEMFVTETDEMDFMYGRNGNYFKRRHFKKALRKQAKGLPLTNVELFHVLGDNLPLYDMDGSYFTEYAEPEITAEDWRR